MRISKEAEKWWESFKQKAQEMGYNLNNPADRMLVRISVPKNNGDKRNAFIGAFSTLPGENYSLTDEYDIRPIEWYFAHTEGASEGHIERMYQAALRHDFFLLPLNGEVSNSDNMHSVNVSKNGECFIIPSITELRAVYNNNEGIKDNYEKIGRDIKLQSDEDLNGVMSAVGDGPNMGMYGDIDAYRDNPYFDDINSGGFEEDKQSLSEEELKALFHDSLSELMDGNYSVASRYMRYRLQEAQKYHNKPFVVDNGMSLEDIQKLDKKTHQEINKREDGTLAGDRIKNAFKRKDGKLSEYEKKVAECLGIRPEDLKAKIDESTPEGQAAIRVFKKDGTPFNFNCSEEDLVKQADGMFLLSDDRSRPYEIKFTSKNGMIYDKMIGAPQEVPKPWLIKRLFNPLFKLIGIPFKDVEKYNEYEKKVDAYNDIVKKALNREKLIKDAEEARERKADIEEVSKGIKLFQGEYEALTPEGKENVYGQIMQAASASMTNLKGYVENLEKKNDIVKDITTVVAANLLMSEKKAGQNNMIKYADEAGKDNFLKVISKTKSIENFVKNEEADKVMNFAKGHGTKIAYQVTGELKEAKLKSQNAGQRAPLERQSVKQNDIKQVNQKGM